MVMSLIVYSSFNQVANGSLQDVYGQILSPAGQSVGGEIPGESIYFV